MVGRNNLWFGRGVLTLIILLALSGRGSAFRFGFGRWSPTRRSVRFLKCSTAQIERPLLPESRVKHQFNNLDDPVLSATMNNFRTEIFDVVLPAINSSSYLNEKYSQNRTIRNFLGGLSDVTDIEYLKTLPVNDPRARLLASISDPGPERRAELIENLQAIDAERGDTAKNKSTYSVYQDVSRDEIDAHLVHIFKAAAILETLRRRRPEFAEYTNASWMFPPCAEPLLQFLDTCFENSENGVVCKHPCMSVYFPYYNASAPHKTCTVA